MRIVFTGGGTGGHFYPIIAIAEAIERLSEEKHLVEPQLFYVGPKPFDPATLAEHDIEYRSSPAGKLSRHGIPNPLNFIRTGWGILQSIVQLFNIYPDVVFSTGGYAAFPTLYAARILAIPVIIYDADAEPGRVTRWSAKFAKWIGVAHPDAAAKLPEKYREKIATIGHPIREEIRMPAKEGGHEYLKLDQTVPTIFFMGGSQGAQVLNNTVLDALKDLVSRYNIIHQTGAANLDEVKGISKEILHDHPNENRYRVFGLLNTLALRMSAGISEVVVARAGSGTIFEVASWGIPAILIPIPLDVSHDQTENAFSYMRRGACLVIEQHNLSPHVLSAEIDRLINAPEMRAKMAESAHKFSAQDAARKAALILLETGLEHEPK